MTNVYKHTHLRTLENLCTKNSQTLTIKHLQFANRQESMQADRLMDKYKNRQTDRQIDRQATDTPTYYRWTDRWQNRWTDILNNKIIQKDKYTDQQSNGLVLQQYLWQRLKESELQMLQSFGI